MAKTPEVSDSRREWLKFTRTGKIFAPLIMFTMFSSFVVAMLSLMSIGQRLGDPRTPLYFYLMLVTSFIHICAMLICIAVVARFKNSMKPERLEWLDGKLGEAFLFIMVCLWWTAVIVAFVAKPTCDVDSEWYAAIATLHSKAPKEKVRDYCQGSLFGLGLSTFNAVFLSVAGGVSLFLPFSHRQPQPILGRFFGLRRPAPPPSELEPSTSEKAAPQPTKPALDMTKYGLSIFGRSQPLVMVELVLLVMFLYPPTPVKQPQWWGIAYVTSIFHICGHTWVQLILAALNAKLRERRMAQVQPWVVRTYVVSIVCLWLAGTTRIFQAQPSCAPGSDWIVSLMPNSSSIENDRTPEEVALGRCPTSMALVALTTLITVLLAGSVLIGPEVGSLLRRARTGPQPLEETEHDADSSLPLLKDEESPEYM